MTSIEGQGVPAWVTVAGPPRAAEAPRTIVRRERRLPGWWRRVFTGLGFASLAVVVALWMAGGGIIDLTSSQLALISVGRLVGLLGASLLLIQVLLMARVPALELSWGQDELARLHRLVGLTSFWFVVVHIVVVVAGYAVKENLDLVGETVKLVTHSPGVLLAVAAAAALIMVVATSIRWSRRRLRYESWHLLHLYAYLGVALALPHQFWIGHAFLTSRAAAVYWLGLWVLAAGAVLIFRVVVPVHRNLTHQVRVIEVVPEGDGVASVVMTGRRLERLPVGAGQFFVWRFLTGPGWMRGHPWSLSAAPATDRLRITVKAVGDGSRGVAGVKPGTRVLIEGPFGRMHEGVRRRRKVLLLAAGIGITPLRALLESIDQDPGDVTMVYRASTPDELVLRAELEALAAQHGARLFYAVGPRVRDRTSWLPRQAGDLPDDDALRQLVPDIHEHEVFVCGAGPWMDAAEAAVLAAGVPEPAVHIERFSW